MVFKMGLKATDPLVFTLKHIAGDDPSLGYRSTSFSNFRQHGSSWTKSGNVATRTATIGTQNGLRS